MPHDNDYYGNTGYAAGSGLANLFKILKYIRDPKGHKREKLMQDLLDDPSKAQALRDNPAALEALEKMYGGPKFLKGFGKGGDFGEYVRALPMSPEGIEKKRLGEAYAQESAAKQTSFANMGGAFDIANATAGMPSAKLPTVQLSEENKDLLESFRSKILGTPTTAQKTKQGLEIKNAQQIIDENEAQKVQRDRENANRTLAGSAYARVKGNIYKDWKKLTPEEQSAILGTKEFNDFYVQKANEHFKEVDDQRARESLALSKEGNELQKKSIRLSKLGNLAQNLVEASGMTISFDDAMDLMENPEALAKIDTKGKPPTDPKQLGIYTAAKVLEQRRTAPALIAKKKADTILQRAAQDIERRRAKNEISAEQALNEYERAAETAYDGLEDFGFSAPKYKIKTEDKGFFHREKKSIVLDDADNVNEAKRQRFNELANDPKYDKKSDAELQAMVEEEFKKRVK